MKKGDYTQIHGHPCEIVSLSTAKNGKHQKVKIVIEAVNIFTREKHEELFPAHSCVWEPKVKQIDMNIHNYYDDGFDLLDENGKVWKKIQADEAQMETAEELIEKYYKSFVKVIVLCAP